MDATCTCAGAGLRTMLLRLGVEAPHSDGCPRGEVD